MAKEVFNIEEIKKWIETKHSELADKMIVSFGIVIEFLKHNDVNHDIEKLVFFKQDKPKDFQDGEQIKLNKFDSFKYELTETNG